MRTLTHLCLSVVLLSGTTAGQRPSSEPDPAFDRADQATLRLQPDTFVDLPSSILEELKRRECTMLQVWYREEEPGNIVRGRFTGSDQIDFAVLCSRSRISSILVFQNSSATRFADLAPARDLDFMQGIGDGAIGFSRSIRIRCGPAARGEIDQEPDGRSYPSVSGLDRGAVG